MLKKRILLLLVLVSSFGLSAFENVEESYNRIFAQWVERRSDPSSTIEKMKDLLQELSRKNDTFEKLYWQAKIHLAMGQIFFYNEQEKESLTYLEASIEIGGKALEKRDDSDAWRILSEAGSFIMIQKGLPYIIANSGRINDQAQKAYDLDPTNVRAALILAQGLINAPALFGGNKRKGRSWVDDLSKERNLSFEDRYFVNLTMEELSQ